MIKDRIGDMLDVSAKGALLDGEIFSPSLPQGIADIVR